MISCTGCSGCRWGRIYTIQFRKSCLACPVRVDREHIRVVEVEVLHAAGEVIVDDQPTLHVGHAPDVEV